MSVTVTLHVFSGLPDPSWELSDEQAQELSERIDSMEKTTLLKPPGVAGGLGYRGFSVTSVRERMLDPHIYLHAGIVDRDRFESNRIADNPDLESWLLGTASNTVHSEIAQFVQSELTGGADAMFAKADASASPLSQLLLRVVPPFDPGKWNNDPNIRTRNNCYNYANDKITNTFAQPGRGSGLMFTALDCANVGAAAQRDGQVPVTSVVTTPAQGHFIALVIWPGQDYHWYRLDSNGQWSHKPGQTAARNTDNSGQLITDPRTCDRGPYTIFCGFYHCIPANTRIA